MGFVVITRDNGIRIEGSVQAWLDYRESMKIQREEGAYKKLSVAKSAEEIRNARDLVAVIEWSKRCQPDGWDGDSPIYGGAGWY